MIPSLIPSYIDPGTLQSMFGSMAPLLAWLAAIAGFMLWPFLWAFRSVRMRLAGLGRWLRLAIFAGVPLAGVGVALGVWWGANRGEMELFGKKKAVQPKAGGVIIIGMDGLDPNILESMMDKGDLPSFDKLRQQGGFHRLQTTTPPESPVAWSSAATGCNPGRHGIFDFIARREGTYLPELTIYHPNEKNIWGTASSMFVPVRKADAFWTYASQAKVPTTVIRWPVAFPPEQVTGRFLSGLGVPDLAGGLGRYQFFSTRQADLNDEEGRSTAVKWNGSRIETELQGPRKTDGKGQATVPLIIERLEGRQAIRLAAGKAPPIDLEAGQWSDWVTVQFKPGQLRTWSGIVRFHLTELTPDLRLYASAVQIDPENPAFPFTSPDGYSRELAAKIGKFHTLGIPEDTHPVSHGRFGLDAFLAHVDKIDAEREAMFDYELGRFESGLLAFVFDSSDRIQHMFWATRDPEHPAYNAEWAAKHAHVIPDMYKKMDRVLGKALAKASGDTVVMVMSDHGFNSYRRSVSVNTWLIANGYMTLKDGATEGKDLFENVDWSKTKAFAVGFCSLYINLKGREKEGIVEPGQPYRDLRQRLVSELTQLQDPKNGQRPIYRVHVAEDVYSGPLAPKAPDLILGFQAGYRGSWQTALGAAPKEIFSDNNKPWAGDHLIDPQFVPGIFLANRKAAEGSQPRLIDIAPTILSCLGIAKPAEMDGVPLF